MRCDLHAHSSVSDGTLRPADLVEHARDCGVAVLTLCDHDDVRGLPEALEAARRHGIELCCGVELSVSEEEGRRQMHVLGLGIEPEDPSLGRLGSALRRTREERARRMVEALQAAGVEIRFEDVQAIAGEASMGRPHVARALVSAGADRDLDDAFARFLRRGRPGFVPRTGLGSRDAIEAIHRAGGVAVLAHPPQSVGVDAPGGLAAFVGRLASAGLDGLEVDHPSHTPPQRKRIRRLARDYELCTTGGSDFHGATKPDVELGRGRRGNVSVGARAYEGLLARRERVRSLHG
jgi:predicted metal-dependent phosphoesterase TrpH